MKNDLPGLAKAYDFLEKINNDNLYYSNACYLKAKILLRCPSLGSLLGRFGGKEPAIIKAYDLLYGLCKSKANGGKAHPHPAAYDFVRRALIKLGEKDKDVKDIGSFLEIFTNTVSVDGKIHRSKTVLEALTNMSIENQANLQNLQTERKRMSERATAPTEVTGLEQHIVKVFILSFHSLSVPLTTEAVAPAAIPLGWTPAAAAAVIVSSSMPLRSSISSVAISGTAAAAAAAAVPTAEVLETRKPDHNS